MPKRKRPFKVPIGTRVREVKVVLDPFVVRDWQRSREATSPKVKRNKMPTPEKKDQSDGDIMLRKKAQDLKDLGNQHFSEFKKREKLMTYERKKAVLNWAIQCYETGYTMCKEALKDKARGHADTAEIVILPREDVVDLMKSLAKNAAVMYMYLAKVETVPGTKLHCFMKSAEGFGDTLRLSRGIKQKPSWFERTIESFSACIDAFHEYIDHFDNKYKGRDALEVFLLKIKCPPDHGYEGFRALLSAEWVELGNQWMFIAVEQISNKNFKEGLNCLGKQCRFKEEAKGYAVSKYDHYTVEVLDNEWNTFLALGEGLQALHMGDGMLERALGEDECINLDLAWDAYDKYKEAELLSKDKDVEILCMSLFNRARIYRDVLKDKYNCKELLREAMSLAQTLIPGPYHNRPWYTKLTTMMQKIRDEEIRAENSKWENQRKKYLEKVQEDVDKITKLEYGKLGDLCEFIFKNHPPKHISNFETKAPDFATMNLPHQGKKPLQKIVTLYHPDRVDKEKYGMEYFVLCEEIAKILNRRYNCIKFCD